MRINLRSIFSLLLRLYQLFRQLHADHHNAELAQRQLFAEAKHQAQVRSHLENPEPSHALGDAALGRLEDARAAGLVNGGKGIFIGAMDGASLSYPGESHGLIIAKNGAGKGLFGTGHILANYTDGSLVLPEVKNGETAFMGIEHRIKRLRQRCWVFNPDGLLGLPHTSINPLDTVVMAIESKESPLPAAEAVAEQLWPYFRKESPEWPKPDAREWFGAITSFYAAKQPTKCTLMHAHMFMNRDMEAIKKDLVTMADSDAPGDVAGWARKGIGMIEQAPKQFLGMQSTYTTALAPFAVGEKYAAATLKTDFKLEKMKERSETLFLLADASVGPSSQKCMALALNSVIERLYRAPGSGRVLFWIEELLQLPVVPALTTALNAYRSAGIQIFAMIQSREGLIDKYGKEQARNWELQAEVVRAWAIEDPAFCRDIEYLAGKKTVVVRQMNANAAAFHQAGFSLGEVPTPLLPAHQLRLLGRTKQLVKMPNTPMLIVDLVPWTEVAQYHDALRDPRTLTRQTRITLPTLGEEGPPCSI